MDKPELLSPAGTPEAAYAAFAAGADAIYLGGRDFSARAGAGNFDDAELSAVIAYAHSLKPARKVYVAVNTVVRESECRELVAALARLESLRPDALIVQDPGVIRLVRRHFPRLELHASTQMAVHSAEGVMAMRDIGCSRVVLARECSFTEIANAVKTSAAQIEVFIHGALCHSYSGLCLYSAMERGRSGNRGRCAYGCREERDGAYPFSMRDLCLAGRIKELCALGVSSLKIEGRMKSALWVSCVTEWYRGLLDGTLTPERANQLCNDVRSVFARQWTTLYADGLHTDSGKVIDEKSLGHRGAPAGRAQWVTPPDKSGTRWLRFRTHLAFERHDGLQLKIPSYLAKNDGHPWGFAVGRIRLAASQREVFAAAPGDEVEIALPCSGDAPQVPVGQEILLASSQDVARRHPLPHIPRTIASEGKAVLFHVDVQPRTIVVEAKDASRQNVLARVAVNGQFHEADNPEKTVPAIREAFSKLGATNWKVENAASDIAIAGHTGLFVPASVLNAVRRSAVAALDKAAAEDFAFRVENALEDCEAANVATTPTPAVTRKWGLEQQPDAGLVNSSGRVVLVLRHCLVAAPDALRERIAAWEEALGQGRKPALALPALARDDESVALDRAIDTLVSDGYADWEASDWAGIRRLRARGLAGWTVDWTIPIENRFAAAQMLSLGAARCVISAETPDDTVSSLLTTCPGRIEILTRQNVPLFISATAPKGGGVGPVRRFGGNPPLTTFLLDGRWITVSDKIWNRSAANGDAPVREDFSFDLPV